MLNGLIQLSYFAAAVLFIVGLKGMSTPVTARQGILWAGVGMVVAVVITIIHPEIKGFSNYLLILIGLGVGGYAAYVSAKKVAMTDMPQMVALYNGMGGGSAGAIAAVYLLEDRKSVV